MNIYQRKVLLKKLQKNEKAILQENKSEQQQKNKWVIMNAVNTVIDLFSKISEILKNAYYYLLL